MNEEAIAAAGGPGRRAWPLPDGLVDLLDLLALLLGAWMVVPTLIAGDLVRLPLPFGGRFSADLSPNNLVILWVVLLVRLHVRCRSGRPSVLAGWFGRERPVLDALMVGAACLMVFLAAARSRAWPCGDTIPLKLVPISLIEQGNLDLDEFVGGIYYRRIYGLFRIGDHYYPVYPIGASLTALPVYAVFSILFPASFESWRAAYSVQAGDDLPNVANVMEQFSAALIAALAAVVFWRICLAVTRRRGASFALAAAFAFGTSLLSTAGLSLWQHGPACLFLGITVLLLLKADARPTRRLGLAGLAAGWAWFCRPTVATMIAVLFAWALLRHRRRALWFGLSCGVVVAAVLAWNRLTYGAWTGGYSQSEATLVRFDPRVTLTLLFSPSRGLFLFSPFLLFAAAWGVRCAVREPGGLPAFLFYAALSNLALFSCWATWAGGGSFGPRYLCEAAMCLALVLPFGWARPGRPRWSWELFVLAALLSCHIHLVGARHGDHGWMNEVFDGDRFGTIWNVRDSQLAWTLGRGGMTDDEVPKHE